MIDKIIKLSVRFPAFTVFINCKTLFETTIAIPNSPARLRRIFLFNFKKSTPSVLQLITPDRIELTNHQATIFETNILPLKPSLEPIFYNVSKLVVVNIMRFVFPIIYVV